MSWLKFLSYLMIGLGCAPLWEKIIKYSFDVEYNFISEWVGIGPDGLLIIGVILMLAGSVVMFFAQKKIAEHHL